VSAFAAQPPQGTPLRVMRFGGTAATAAVPPGVMQEVYP
jgi:hypothetical protein